MMKNGEERKQEILRRSQARIAKRRKGRKLLACCVCLLLTGVVLAGRGWDTGAFEATNAGGRSDVGYDALIPEGMEKPVLEHSAANAPAENINQSADNVLQEDKESARYSVSGTQGLELAIGELDLENGILTAALSNFSGAPAAYGECFDIEYWGGEDWNSCQQEGTTVTTQRYMLASGDTVTARYFLDSFDLSAPGEYRLVKYVELEETDACCKLVAEFTVEEEAP